MMPGDTPPLADPSAQNDGYRGSPWPWLALFVMFGLLILNAGWNYFRPSEVEAAGDREANSKMAQAQMSVRMTLSLQQMSGNSPAIVSQSRTTFRRVLEDLPTTGTEPLRLRAALRQESNLPANRQELAKLPPNDPFREIYGAEKLSKAEAERLAGEVENQKLAGQLAAIHALEKAGVPNARDGRISSDAAVKILLVAFAATAILGVGVLGWIAFFLMRQQLFPDPGNLPWMRDRQDADAAAIRVALIMFTFLLVSSLAQRLGLPAGMGSIVSAVAIILATIGIVSMPILGRPISMQSLGFRRGAVGRQVFYGVVLFCMELPLVGLLAVVAQQLLKNLPSPSHPASTELMNSPSALTVAGILMLGGIAAPFWEEICFRALFFAGLARKWLSLVAPALLTSFIFAMIHPQGPILWVALATVGAVACLGAYYTRGIVASITMHMAHNLTLLTMSLLLFS